jgi:hypothetical protein
MNTTVCVPLPHLRMETDPVSETACSSLLSRISDDGRSPRTHSSRSTEPFRTKKGTGVYVKFVGTSTEDAIRQNSDGILTLLSERKA